MPHGGLGGLGIVPEIRLRCLALEALYFQFLAGDVKDGPEGMRCGLVAGLFRASALPSDTLPQASGLKGMYGS